MRAVVLCGGVAKRMQPLREDKFLLDFLGKPLLLHTVQRLCASGVDDFVFVVGPHNISAVQSFADTLGCLIKICNCEIVVRMFLSTNVRTFFKSIT